MPKRILIFIVVVIIIMKIPGLFWGVNPYPKTKLEWFDRDEQEYIRRTIQIATGRYTKCYHTLGFSVQLAILNKILHIEPSYTKKNLILGRSLSLIYGVGLSGLIFLLTLKLWGQSAALYTLTIIGGIPLVNIYSHISVANIANTFYFYLIIYLTILIQKRKLSIWRLLLLSICTAVGLSMIGNLTILFAPVLLIGIQERKKLPYLCLFFFSLTFFFFYIANGLHLKPQDIYLTIKHFQADLLNVIPNHKDIYNLMIIPFTLIVSITLPVLFFAIKGLKIFFTKPKISFPKLCLIIPIVIYSLGLFFIDIPFDRYFLPILPLVSILAGVGMSHTKIKFPIYLTLFYLYLGTISVEYNFWYETREKAYPWIISHLPVGSKIYLAKYFKPKNFYILYRVTPSIQKAEYFIFHERFYRRYLRSAGNPFTSRPENIYHPIGVNRKYIQNIFTDKNKYKIIKKFSTFSILPEHMIRKYTLGSYPDIIGDVIVAQKINSE